MEFRKEALAAKIHREVSQNARRLPSSGSRVVVIAGVVMAAVFTALFLMIPVGGETLGLGQLAPEHSSVVRATRAGTLRWVIPVGTEVNAGERVALVNDGSMAAELAASQIVAETALLDYLRFPGEPRFAQAVPGAVSRLRGDQSRVQSGHPRSSASGRVLLSSLRAGDEVRAGQLIAIVGEPDSPLQLHGSFPVKSRTLPGVGDRLRLRWGDSAEQWASFRVVRVSAMASESGGANPGAKPGTSDLHFVAAAVPEHEHRLIPGLHGVIELTAGGQTLAGVAWRSLVDTVELMEGT